jgi:7-carboxy-7-deazaguanine synthase (Cx14CxxC type)
MVYSVKEIFYSLQGEGMHAGRPAIFCRFSGCNLWNGLEKDRASSICTFCDTDFLGGDKFKTSSMLVDKLDSFWPSTAASHRKYIIFTGGEPLLQLNKELIEKLHALDYTIGIETNGTIEAPPGIDWICVSPKKGATLKIKKGNELKLVFPQEGLSPESFLHLDFKNFYLQPMDGPNLKKNTDLAVDYCKSNPEWVLSLQTHKLLGIL